MLARILRALLLVELAGAAAIAGWLATRGWSLPEALLGGAFGPLSVHGGIIAADFAIARLAGSETPPQWRPTPVQAIAMYLRELALSIRTFTFAQPLLAHLPLAGARIATPGRLPVLMIHGYFCNRGLWRPLARHLANRGHPTGAIDLEPVFGSIDAYGPRIADALAELRRAHAGPVVLVCHSMGGLAARAYLRRYGPDGVAAVVTLGTPHRGTVLARLGHGRNVRQMRPDSDWLRSLAADESSVRRQAPFTVVLSHHDNIVVPQADQTVPGARTVELGRVGHIALAYDRRAWEIVERALDDAAATDATDRGAHACVPPALNR